jgi:hypothetical protein
MTSLPSLIGTYKKGMMKGGGNKSVIGNLDEESSSMNQSIDRRMTAMGKKDAG